MQPVVEHERPDAAKHVRDAAARVGAGRDEVEERHRGGRAWQQAGGAAVGAEDDVGVDDEARGVGPGAEERAHAGDGVGAHDAAEPHEERHGVAGRVAGGAQGEEALVRRAVHSVEREHVPHRRLHGLAVCECGEFTFLLAAALAWSGERAWAGVR